MAQKNPLPMSKPRTADWPKCGKSSPVERWSRWIG